MDAEQAAQAQVRHRRLLGPLALAAVALKIVGQGASPGFCAPVHRTSGQTLARSALASREVFAEERSDYEEDSEAEPEAEDDLGVPKLTRSAFKLETSRQDADKLDIDAVSAMVQGELSNAGFKVQMHDGQPSMDLVGAGDAEVLRAAAAALRQHALRREPPTEDLLAEQQVDPLVVSSLMWSCGRLVADTRPLLPTLRDVVIEAAPDMNAQNLTSCWCSAANLQPYAEEVDEMIPALLTAVLPKAADLQPSQLVAFIWASGKLDLRQDEVAQISALPKRLRRFELEMLPLKDIANFVFGLSQLDFRDMDVLGMIAKTATGRAAKSKRKEAHQDLPMIVMSLTRLGYKDVQMNLLLDAVADRLQKTRMLKKMPDWSLAALFWAWPQDGSLEGVRNMQELLAPEVQQRMQKKKFTSRMLERSWMGPADAVGGHSPCGAPRRFGGMTTQTEEQKQQSRWDYPINDATKGEVRARYTPAPGEVGQLTLNVGDIVWVLEEEDGWCGGHKDGDDNTGWFPASIINRIPRGDCQEDDEDDRRNSALYTSDHRAVASPQAKHQKVSAQLELAETKQRLEAAESERRRLEEVVKGLQKEKNDWEHERRGMVKRYEELQHSKVQSAQEEARRKEEELRSQKEINKILEADLRSEKGSANSLKGKLKELEEHCRKLKVEVDHLKTRQTDTASREDAISGSTTGISRTYAGDSGHRTPSVPHTVSGVLSGSLQAPPAPCVSIAPTSSMTSVGVGQGQVSASPLSARQPAGTGLAPRHASPRHASWMPPTGPTVHAPSSPHLRQRIPSQRDVTLDSVSHAPPVRKLVSEIEKRSNSQGAPTTRETAPTNRQLVFPAAAPSVSSCCTVRRPMASVPILTTGHVSMTSAVRAGSREGQPVARTMRTVTQSSSRSAFQVEPEPETPNASPNVTHMEDPSRNFGMSPIKRQAYTITRGGLAGSDRAPDDALTSIAANLCTGQDPTIECKPLSLSEELHEPFLINAEL
eukprot:s4543_g2.t1